MTDAIICHMAFSLGNIVLASASPRRRRLLAWLGLEYQVLATDTPESLQSPLASDPPALAISLAEEKLEAAGAIVAADDCLVMAFDTIVVLDGKLLGKPADEADARRMLAALADRTHQVVTGCAMQHRTAKFYSRFAVTSEVRMRALSHDRIDRWLASGEYVGCAGAYNIESQIAEVGSIECFQNVAGLPLCHVYSALREVLSAKGGGGGYSGLLNPIARCDAELGRTCKLGPKVVRG